jgi:BirA family biotin operon repressor/biotin-[acetyl-CoA-carboxylase] ligase
MLDAWRSAEPDAFARAWLARAHSLGTPLKVHSNGDTYVSGTFAGIEPDGALRLDVGGEIQVIRAGDVHLS